MQHNFYRHFHLPDTDTRSVTAFVQVSQPSKDGASFYHVAFALCMESDNFSRARGRRIAKNRFDSGRFIEVKQESGEPLIKSLVRSLDGCLGIDMGKQGRLLSLVHDTLKYDHIKEYELLADDELPTGWFYGKLLPFFMQFSFIRKLANVNW